MDAKSVLGESTFQTTQSEGYEKKKGTLSVVTATGERWYERPPVLKMMVECINEWETYSDEFQFKFLVVVSWSEEGTSASDAAQQQQQRGWRKRK